MSFISIQHILMGAPHKLKFQLTAYGLNVLTRKINAILITISVLGGSPNIRPRRNSVFTLYQIPGVGPHFFQNNPI